VSVTAHKDLRPRMGACRDQGQRPTCLAFAVSDAHAAARQNPQLEPLSPEYLFYHGTQRSPHKDPKRGLTFNLAVTALEAEGQPHETAWPYIRTLPTDLKTWTPPSTVTVYRALVDRKGISGSALREIIDQDKVPFAVVRITRSFFKPSSEGLIENKAPDQDSGLHGITVVGHGEFQKSRVFLLRNSWGTRWGLNGYAWAFEDYILPRITILALVKQ
jgi:C1A family cysteine protease